MNEESKNYIRVRGAREHNLKDVDVDIPCHKLVVITGLSGSGKSSLAFDTIYAEGQRRYVESLSAYARQFLHIQNKPDVTSISGLSPAIAIDQRASSRNPRSTVGTVTEIGDYLRLLFARIGVPFSPATGLPIRSQTVTEMVDTVLSTAGESGITILAPIARGKKGEFQRELEAYSRQGFTQAIIDGEVCKLSGAIPHLEKNKHHTIEIVVDKFIASASQKQRLAEALESALKLAGGIAVALFEGQKRALFSERYSCPVSGFQLPSLEPRLFSFNSPLGACPACQGLGEIASFCPELLAPDPSISIKDGAIACLGASQSQFVRNTLSDVLEHYGCSIDMPLQNIPEAVREKLFYGSGEEEIAFRQLIGQRLVKLKRPFDGVLHHLAERISQWQDFLSEEIAAKYQERSICTECNGFRLKSEALCVKVAGMHIGQVLNLPVGEACSWIDELPSKLGKKENEIASQVIKEIKARFGFLKSVGLDYLSLARPTSTLSGGESQRIRLASQIGSGLSGVLYVLDEPSIGLHQRDNEKLIATLLRLKSLGNSVLVVEHDSETMFASDYIIDMGPGAGVHGGRVVAQGKIEQILASTESLTGQYLSGKKTLERRPPPSSFSSWIELTGAKANNLKNVNVKIPVGALTVVTGVSGSGKSSLILETLYPAINRYLDPNSRVKVGEFEKLIGVDSFNKVVEIDQSPIGKTPRSNPATYIGVFSLIRDMFAFLPESKVRGYKVGRFSFNVKGGRCEACKGDGLLKIEMHFLQDVYVKCDECNGARYNRETLEILYRGKSISDVLEMTVESSLDFFQNVNSIFEKIKVLNDVGLGYLKLGQSSTTLSGGEAQRIKLARELSRKTTGRTLYILDEPTTGLHFEDINKLLKILYGLVELGNTVIVIEHNLDVIERADYIVDVGPEGGDKGGTIVASGRPYEIAACSESFTGKFLKKTLQK